MKNFTSLRAIVPVFSIVLFTIFATAISTQAQVVRPYGAPLYSDNLHGGHTIFGNTITAIYSSGSGSTGVVNTTAMNDFQTTNTGSYTNSRTSAYTNNSSNIQFVDVDGGGSTTALLSYGGLWRYYSLNNYSAAPPNISSLNWTEDSYNDASNWTNTANNSNAFGFGESNVNSPAQTNRSTYYLRRDINIVNPSQYSTITLTVKHDDGAIVYVNGIEAARMNMPEGNAPYGTNPSNSREFDDGDYITTIPVSYFANGNNQISVAVYNRSNGNNDLYYDMKLEGNIINTTFNSSSADLVLPAGSNSIKFARLYWGGRIDGGTGGAANINLRTVKLRKGTSGAYTDVVAPISQIDKSLISGSDSAYQSYVDVTGFVNTNGTGTYTVANVMAATGSASAGNYAAWTIVVVYENAAVAYNSVRVYDGYLQVFNGGPLSITLTGLTVPSAPLVSSDAYMTALSWEGDANLAVTSGNPLGDYIKVNGTIASSGVNLAANFWNGTISKNGNFITTKNPDFKNQMSIDIDEMEVGTGYGIVPGATQVSIEFGSEADQYFPSIFAFTIRAKDPDIIMNKSVTDNLVPFGTVQVNETLTYTLSGANIGLANAYNCVVVDTIPSNVIYIPGSLQVVNAPGIPSGFKTDLQDGDHAFKAANAGKDYVKFYIGTGATSTSGGILAAGETYTLRFKVITPSLPGQLSTVINSARITGQNIFGDPFADDGTATIALGAITPVKMTSFAVKKENINAVLKWTTSSETKNGHFDIERSTDGFNFSKVGVVAGSGTTTLTKSYSYPDDLSNVTSKIVYYRLRIVDIDGESTFSQIVALRIDGSLIVKNLIVYPNPFKNHIKLELQSLKEEKGLIRIVNTSGQEIVKRTVTVQPGGNIVVVKDLEVVAPGLYMMEIRIGEDVIVQKIMKQ